MLGVVLKILGQGIKIDLNTTIKVSSDSDIMTDTPTDTEYKPTVARPPPKSKPKRLTIVQYFVSLFCQWGDKRVFILSLFKRF